MKPFAFFSPCAFVIALLALTALGGYLRLQQLAIQWLADDEWHAIHKIVTSEGYLPILSSFGQADYSIPLTVYDKLVADTVGLSELRMRVPMVASGIAFLLLGTLWARARLGPLPAAVFGFLLAVSPLLVNYSRNARPYMITLLAASVAVWALLRWSRDRRWRAAAPYLACAWLASYLHPIMTPFVLAPLAIITLRDATAARDRNALLRQSLAVGVAAVAGVAALVLPPLIHDWSAMAGKTGTDLPTGETLAGVWHVWLGTGSAPVVVLGLGLAAVGLSPLRKAAPIELAAWLAGLLGICAAILLLRPAWVHNPLTLGRYLLPALPLLLLLMSAGIARVALLASSPARAGMIAAALLPAFLVGTPHADLIGRPNNFTLHSYYQFDYRTADNPVRRAFSEFSAPSPFWNRFKGAPAGSHIIAVAGLPGFETYFNLHPLYQPHHRQYLINLQTSGACGPAKPGEAFPHQGIHLRNAASLAVAGDLAAKHIDWIVLDRRLERHLHATGADDAAQTTAYTERCLDYLINRFGAPEYTDDALYAFHIRNRHAVHSGTVGG